MPRVLGARTASPARVIKPKSERSSPRERGYSAAWDRLSTRWRREHPFCAFCEQEGRIRFCDVVDHIIPVADGGPLLDRCNLQSLCNSHHNGLKRQLEERAREIGRLAELPLWCADPASRPR